MKLLISWLLIFAILFAMLFCAFFFFGRDYSFWQAAGASGTILGGSVLTTAALIAIIVWGHS